MVATVRELAALVRGRVVGDDSRPITAARPVNEAGPGDITFIDDDRYLKALRASPASAVLIGPHFAVQEQGDRPESMTLIEVDEPRVAFLAVHGHLRGAMGERWVGIDPRAYIAPTARIGEGVAIYPFSYIGDGAEIGDGCTIQPGAHVGPRCKLGRGVALHPNVVLYADVELGDRVVIHANAVLGADGFGYRTVEGRHAKIPQNGGVVVGDDVEIGACCTIDRGTFEPTRIGAGTKVDNLVMIGHNNRIGRHNILCGQVGIAGSCSTGDYVVMAGQAGIKDHTNIGDAAKIGAQAGVHRDVPAGSAVLGSPAMPGKQQAQLFALIARLPEMQRHLRKLSAEVKRLSASASASTSTDASEAASEGNGVPPGLKNRQA